MKINCYSDLQSQIKNCGYLWVPGTGLEKKVWVPMGTGYRPNSCRPLLHNLMIKLNSFEIELNYFSQCFLRTFWTQQHFLNFETETSSIFSFKYYKKIDLIRRNRQMFHKFSCIEIHHWMIIGWSRNLSRLILYYSSPLLLLIDKTFFKNRSEVYVKFNNCSHEIRLDIK